MSLNKEKTVLLIEDDDFFRFILEKTLKKMNKNIVAARAGSEALQSIDQIGKDRLGWIILDCSLPDMDGLEFIEKLKGSDPKILEYISVIPWSSFDGDSPMARQMKEKVGRFEVKPFSLDAIRDLLNKHLDEEPIKNLN